MAGLSRRTFATAAVTALPALLATGAAAPAAGGSAVTAPAGAAVTAPAGAAGGGGAPAGAMRGMWLATVGNRDWPSRPGLNAARQRDELLRHLDAAVRRRLNTVIFQVRPTADALWPSRYEPWSAYLTGTQGKNPGWDPLGTAVTEAHARGLELHAWFNPYRVAAHTQPSRLVAGHPARKHPGWVVPYGGKLYYNPGLPEVRAFVQDAVLDAVERYPVDAVHFDDYFYPYPVAGQTFGDAAAYKAHGAAFSSRAAWRRNNVDLLVKETAKRIRAARPGTRFGISPFGVWRNASTDRRGSDTRGGVQTYDDLYADTRKWVRGGWIDYVVPQLYWHIGQSAADYAVLAEWWADTTRGTGTALYLGEALYKAGDPKQAAAWQNVRELSRHLELAAALPEVGGHVFFSAKEVAADPSGAMARVVKDHYGG